MADVVDQRGQHQRVVGEVGVHLHADLGAVVDGLAQPGTVRLAQPVLARSAEDLDVAQLGGERFGAVGGAVGAAVVDDEDRASGATLRTSRSSRSMLSISLNVGTTTVARTVDEPTLTG